VRRSVLLRAAAVGGAAAVTAAALLPGSSTAAAPTGGGVTTAAVSPARTAFTATGAAGEPVLGARTYTEVVLQVSATSLGSPDFQQITVEAPSVRWTLSLAAPDGQHLAPGHYRNADGRGSGRLPGLTVRTSATSCAAEIFGSYDIEQYELDAAGALTAIEVSFVQRCGSATAPALKGTLWWRVTPLQFRWSADAGDPVTGGGSGTLTGADALFDLDEYLGSQEYRVDGPRREWLVLFNPPTGQAQFQPGTYQVAGPYGTATKAGLTVGGCQNTVGTLTIREVAYSGAAISALDASFVRRCTAGGPALRGTIQYHAGTFPALPPAT
jgi:hypothetical protein